MDDIGPAKTAARAVDPTILIEAFTAAWEKWKDDCQREGVIADPPSPSRSLVRPGSVELRSINGHLATYNFSKDGQGRVVIGARAA